MDIGTKIMMLRKERGYSQEELASILEVSRQSVSKWELGDSTPDLDKIIRLCELFEVSVDSLVRPDETLENTAGENRLSDADAQDMIQTRQKNIPILTLGISLCIFAPSLLLVLSQGLFPAAFLNPDQGSMLGLILMFLMLTAGVGMIVFASSQTDRFEWMERQPVQVSAAVYKEARQELARSEKPCAVLLTLGICVILAGVTSLLAVIFLFGEERSHLGTALLLVFVSIGAGLIIYSSSIQETWQILLQEGDYSPSKKAVRKKYSWLPGTYWCIVTAVYLAISLPTQAWDWTWILFAVAGVLYGGIVIFLNRKTSGDR